MFKALGRLLTANPMKYVCWSFTDVVSGKAVNKYWDGKQYVHAENRWGFGGVVPCNPPSPVDEFVEKICPQS